MLPEVLSFSELKKSSKKEYDGKIVKTALVADSAMQLLTVALKGIAYKYGLRLSMYDSGYNQLLPEIFTENSGLHQFNTEYIITLQSFKKIQYQFYQLENEHKEKFYLNYLQSIRDVYNASRRNNNCKVIVCNFPEYNDSVFGSFANKTPASLLYQLRKINCGLMDLSIELPDLFICDVAGLASRQGLQHVHDNALHANADMLFNPEFQAAMAKSLMDIIAAAEGKAKKCLILDLDNTCWGGIIGDDGLDKIQIGGQGMGKIFQELQHWFKQLKERGIILALCSKNYEHIAREVFEQHPEMVLRADDIAVFAVNWNNKVDNICFIQQVLQVGFDSMVYIDDNAFERTMVRENIPGITVPELPANPEDYLSFLQQLNLFETISHTREDGNRTKKYQANAERTQHSQLFSNEAEFLRSLNMTATVLDFSAYVIPRAVQLINRSNQFNLRTKRYSEGQINELLQDNDCYLKAFTLKDKFGDSGISAVIILKRVSPDSMFIDTWIMSCTILKRSMEQFVMNTIATIAQDSGCRYILGEYLPTPKNALVKDHYQNLGFLPSGDKWLLDLENFSKHTTFINSSYAKNESLHS